MRITGPVPTLVTGPVPPRRDIMSMMGKLKSMLKGHETQAGKGVDKAGDYVDERTGSKYGSQVDTAQERLKDELGREQGRDDPPHT